jgi:hypothetical protein
VVYRQLRKDYMPENSQTNVSNITPMAKAPEAPKMLEEPKLVRTLNITLQARDDRDLGEVVAAARELGETNNLNYSEYLDRFGGDLLF